MGGFGGRASGRVVVAGLVLVAFALQGCYGSTVRRPGAPVVLTGAEVPDLVGTDPGLVVAFRYTTTGTNPRWVQIPVQVDQRKVVPFGTQPTNNTSPGVPGTVYGSGSGGPTALQYADANTWVGADTDPNVDADDEIVFMASDAGGDAPVGVAPPPGTVAGSGVTVDLQEPTDAKQRGVVYLFRSTGALDPSAGKDYVTYTFRLTSGDYKTTYKRRTGPNPETSAVVTPAYEIGFTDRWMETSWKVLGPGSTRVDVLDGHKNQFLTGYCGRSNVTFASAEGAFVANIDGPVRAIRSYVGANSGPLTQRTHVMYRDRQDVITDLRVHSIPAIMDFVDYSAAAIGMTYRSSTVPNGVTIDGAADAVPAGPATWESVDGPQGRVYSASTFEASQPGLVASGFQFYRDQVTPTESQCWGDTSYYGASGAFIAPEGGIDSTDPALGAAETLRATRTTEFRVPVSDGTGIPADAATWATKLATPLTVTVRAYP